MNHSIHLRTRAALLVLIGVFGCSAGCATSVDEGATGTSEESLLNANDKTAYLFFIGKGLKNFQAAGIVGNLDQESSMSPTVAQYGGGPGRGIAQWSVGGRWDTSKNDNVVAYAAKMGESATSLNLQLEFIWYELQTFSGYGLSHLTASTDVTSAVIAFQNYYEGCGTCAQGQRVSYAQQTLSAYGSLTPPPPPAPPAPKGHLDGVTCASIAGWAQDPSAATTAVDVDLWFDGASGAAGALGPLTVKAGTSRSDLCTPLGSCNHGFTQPLPLAMQDGAAHKVYAYGKGSAATTAPALIANAPLSITCAPPAIPASTTEGVRRLVPTSAILAAWKLGGTDGLSIAHVPLVALNAYTQGPDLPKAPEVIQADDGSPQVWLVDGAERRHVVSPASMTAWQLGTPKKTPAAAVNAMPAGADWPETPYVFLGSGTPQVYVLDSAPGQTLPPASGGSSGATSGDPAAPSGDPAAGSGTTAPASDAQGSGGGCAIGPDKDARDGLAWLGLSVVGLVVSARRRRRA